jgi:hypothetical protein
MYISVKKQSEIPCGMCGNTFFKDTSEIKRQLKRNKTSNFYCSPKCVSDKTKQHHTKWDPCERNCLQFGNVFMSSTKPKKHKKCCSDICAKRYAQSCVIYDENFSKKMSEISKKIWSTKPRVANRSLKSQRLPKINQFYENLCVICNNPFQAKLKKIKTCSKLCRNELLRIRSTNHPNCGGETNYKRYIYKGIIMDSSWEVKLAEWLDEIQVEWKRSRSYMFYWIDKVGRKRRYYPDFYLPTLNVYCDPKNKYLQEKDRYKIESATRENNVTVYWGYLDNIKKSILDSMSGHVSTNFKSADSPIFRGAHRNKMGNSLGGNPNRPTI